MYLPIYERWPVHAQASRMINRRKGANRSFDRFYSLSFFFYHARNKKIHVLFFRRRIVGLPGRSKSSRTLPLRVNRVQRAVRIHEYYNIIIL